MPGLRAPDQKRASSLSCPRLAISKPSSADAQRHRGVRQRGHFATFSPISIGSRAGARARSLGRGPTVILVPVIPIGQKRVDECARLRVEERCVYLTVLHHVDDVDCLLSMNVD